MSAFKVLGIAAVVAFLLGLNAEAGTLEDVKARGHLRCGTDDGLPGFAFKYPDGRWAGLDVDTCRAVAAAVLGDADKVKYVELSTKERFPGIQSGAVDMFARNSTWTLLRDSAYELNFAAVIYYDGQGFMVRKELGLGSAEELEGATICVLLGTTTEFNLVDFFGADDVELFLGDDPAELAAAYDRGECDAMANDRSALAGFRTKLENPGAHVILPDILSKEPLGPIVRHGDDRWFDIVKWTIFALIQAEESGVTSQNVDEMKTSQDPTIQRLLGVSADLGLHMGLRDDWAFQIIKQVGNYGEIYERNLGPDTPVGLERGLNALWEDGGLMYAMPFR
jgi:general L-amino acid transport system substrate-binding protein